MADTGTAGELLGWLWAAFKILSLLAIIYLAVVEARRYRRKAVAKRREGEPFAEAPGDESGREDSTTKVGGDEAPQEGTEAEPKE